MEFNESTTSEYEENSSAQSDTYSTSSSTDKGYFEGESANGKSTGGYPRLRFINTLPPLHISEKMIDDAIVAAESNEAMRSLIPSRKKAKRLYARILSMVDSYYTKAISIENAIIQRERAQNRELNSSYTEKIKNTKEIEALKLQIKEKNAEVDQIVKSKTDIIGKLTVELASMNISGAREAIVNSEDVSGDVLKVLRKARGIQDHQDELEEKISRKEEEKRAILSEGGTIESPTLMPDFKTLTFKNYYRTLLLVSVLPGLIMGVNLGILTRFISVKDISEGIFSPMSIAVLVIMSLFGMMGVLLLGFSVEMAVYRIADDMRPKEGEEKAKISKFSVFLVVMAALLFTAELFVDGFGLWSLFDSLSELGYVSMPSWPAIFIALIVVFPVVVYKITAASGRVQSKRDEYEQKRMDSQKRNEFIHTINQDIKSLRDTKEISAKSFDSKNKELQSYLQSEEWALCKSYLQSIESYQGDIKIKKGECAELKLRSANLESQVKDIDSVIYSKTTNLKASVADEAEMEELGEKIQAEVAKLEDLLK